MNGIKLYMLFLSEVLLKIRNRKKIAFLAQIPTKFVFLENILVIFQQDSCSMSLSSLTE